MLARTRTFKRPVADGAWIQAVIPAIEQNLEEDMFLEPIGNNGHEQAHAATALVSAPPVRE
jgi:hypothetical protein